MSRWRVPLAAELVLGILAVLVISNAATLYVSEHRRVTQTAAERFGALEERLTAFAHLLAKIPESERERLQELASARHEKISVGRVPRVGFDSDRDDAAERKLRRALRLGESVEVRVAKRGRPELWPFAVRPRGGYERYAATIAIAPGRWLNAEFYWPIGQSLVPGILMSAGISALLLVVLSFWISYRLSQPLRAIASASELAQRGRTVAPVVAHGPDVVQRAVLAFNKMTQRLVPAVDSQRLVLASVGHDLRSPITSLRLNSEFIEDEALKQQFNGSLDELQQLTEAAMQAAKGGVTDEEARWVDIHALAELVCAEQNAISGSVSFDAGARVDALCRVNEIKRALRNLIENAVKYGGSARVSARRQGASVALLIQDDGPGIADDLLAKAFQPFERLGAQAKQGHGLGLTLARAIARAHGGDITLRNRPGGGLDAEMVIAAR